MMFAFQQPHWSNLDRHYEGDSQHRCLYLSGLAPGEELIPECEVIYEDEDDGLDSKFDWCEKNPKHKNFIPFCDFTKDDLPPALRMEEVMDFIQSRIDLTVRIKFPYTTKERPDFLPGEEMDKTPYPYMHHKGNKNFTRNGTGTVLSVSPPIDKTCPCPMCRDCKKPKQKHFLLTVRTVTHNVFNNEEANVAVVECFFNNEDDGERGVIREIYGLHLDETDGKKETMHHTDVCDLICVSHDEDTVERFVKLLSRAKAMPDLPDFGPFTEIIISHPHGCTKRISVGSIPYLTIPLGSSYKTSTPTHFPKGTTKYRVSSKKEKDNEIQIPPGSTFTLPMKAEYAMRYHFGDERNYLSFPSGTKFTLGNQLELMPEGVEFEVGKDFVLDEYYTCNIVGSCAGTSGAMVYSNLMEDEVLTDMAHTSTLRTDKLNSLVRTKATAIPER